MTHRKKLIEVALPLDAINAASAREKAIRHGHPSTLHLWWARRPLAAARAVIFSQMVDDPSTYVERQRFGRLDRLGEYDRRSADRAPTARAVILARTDLLAKVDDPIYGPALPRTWEWLSTIAEDGVVDFGIFAIEPHIGALGGKIDELVAPSSDAPVLLPAYLDQWVQTNPRPYADPDVSLFLHGIPEDGRAAVPDVQVVWRADLEDADLARQFAARQDSRALFEHLAMVPPGSLEAISLPVWTVRAWLTSGKSDSPPDDVADVDGNTSVIEDVPPAGRYVVHWRASVDRK